jgi:anti-anti-sigma factor
VEIVTSDENTIRERRRPHGGSIIAFVGELDLVRRPYLRQTLGLLEGPIVFELSGVRYVDSSALNEFALYARRITPARAVLAGMQPHVRRVLQIVRFDRLFIFDRRHGAMA